VTGCCAAPSGQIWGAGDAFRFRRLTPTATHVNPRRGFARDLEPLRRSRHPQAVQDRMGKLLLFEPVVEDIGLSTFDFRLLTTDFEIEGCSQDW